MSRSPNELEALRAEAITLRQAGIGGKRIAKQLGIGGALVCELLRGVPVPAALLRPQAKDDLREAAVLLRSQGRTYDEIRAELDVSKGSLSLWLRELPHPTKEQRAALQGQLQPICVEASAGHRDVEIARQLRSEGWLLREVAGALSVTEKTVCLWTGDLPIPPRAMHGGSAEHARRMGRNYWDAELAKREAERAAVKAAAAARIGCLTERELELIAITAYWCEGSKDKAYDRREMVTFINSDPGLIQVFLRWLRAVSVPEHDLQVGISIHEGADVHRAHRFWSDLSEIPVARFSPPNLKKHNPKTVRKNTGDDYYGCLIIRVRKSRSLYQKVAGGWRGIVEAAALADTQLDKPSRIVQRQDNGL